MTKKWLSIILCLLMIFQASVSLASEPGVPQAVSHRYVNLTVGETQPFTLVSGGVNTVIVSAEGNEYASLENGVITAKSAGKAVLVLQETGPDGVLMQGTLVVNVAAAPAPSLPTSAVFSSASFSMTAGSTAALSLTQDSSETPSYSSSNAGVVSVGGGIASGCTLTALSAGSATITASFQNGVTASCTVTVSAGLTLSLSHNAPVYLTREIYDFTVKDGSGNVITGATVTSSNPSVASMSDSTHLRTGSSSGTVTLTASYQGVSSAPLTITVYPEPQNLSLSPNSTTLSVGSTFKISPSVSPSAAQTRYSYSILAGSDVVSVSSDGTVTAKKSGSATVQVSTHNGLHAAFSVTVPSTAAPLRYVSISQNPIAVGAIAQVFLVDAAGNRYQPSRYSSSNSAVAVLDSNGTLRGVSAGETTITCTDSSGNPYSTTLKVYAAPGKLTAVPSASTLSVGQTAQIALSSDVALTFPYTVTSYNTAVVEVDSSNPLLLRAKSAGTATIVVMAYNNKYASFQVTVTASSSSTPSASTATVAADGTLNLRSSPSQSSHIYLQIPQYATVQVLSYGATWCQVTYGGYTGYVMTRYLSFGPSSAPVTPSVPSTGSVVCYGRVTTASGSLNLRSYASSAATILTRIPQYAYVDVHERGTVWCYVSYNGWRGYVMTQFLTFSTSKPSTPVTPSVPSTPGVSGSTAQVITASGSLNLRVSNYYGARILTRIPQYAYVTVLTYGSTWCYVSYGGYTGYVMTQYLSTSGSSSSGGNSASSSSTAVVNTSSGSLNLRIRAVYGSTILTRIPQYASVTVLEKGASWSKVSYGGYTGYVMTEYLRFR